MTFLRKATIEPSYFLIAFLPAAVLLASVFLLVNFAEPFDVRPMRMAEFSVPAEGAARISVLAAFMIVIGAAGAAIALFLFLLRGLSWTDWLLAGVTFVALAVGAEVSTEGYVRSAEVYAGRTLFCIASVYSPDDSTQARAEELKSLRDAQGGRTGAAGPGASPGQAAGIAVERLRFAKSCSHPAMAREDFRGFARRHGLERFISAHNLADLQYALIVLAFSGLVVGAICCLANPRGRGSAGGADGETRKDGDVKGTDGAGIIAELGNAAEAERPDLAHWELQSTRLNTCLYLGALLLGSSLLFIGAFLRWPQYALIDPAPYADHVNAMLAYYGSTFSVMLTAFYMPAAAILSLKVGASSRDKAGETKLPEAFQGPLQILKIVIGLGATTFAGALPQIIDMIG